MEDIERNATWNERLKELLNFTIFKEENKI
jgi:hypothetical protein